MRPIGAACLLVLAFGCRGTPAGRAQGIAALVDSLRPNVEAAAGIRFRSAPKSELRSRDEVRAYLLSQLEKDFSPSRQEGLTSAYRLLGLLPDTLDLRVFLLDLYTEQVAGFYDPETRTLVGVRGAAPDLLRFTLAHEIVHALQHEVLPLDQLMRMSTNSDALAATQAVLEGHAMLVSLRSIPSAAAMLQNPELWRLARETIQNSRATMKVFSSAPQVLQESMIFPYLDGAEFMRWWDSARAGRPLPGPDELPRSTEQILHPGRSLTADPPVGVAFADSSSDVIYEDTFGEFELQLLATVLRGGGEVLTHQPAGWGGDRYRVYRSAAGPALVWYLAFDDSLSASRFRGGPGTRLRSRGRPGYRIEIDSLSVSGKPGARVVIAPTAWDRWPGIPPAN
ncbi:MAG: hypothetical protein ACRENB_04895 [Gemmatimonadales bacterium]